MNSFVEVCIFQVKPDKVDEFEKLIDEMERFQKEFDGTIEIKYMKRTHTLDGTDVLNSGEPAKKLIRIIKAVKYVFYWELMDSTVHGKATMELFQRFGRDFNRLLVMPADKLVGDRVF